MEGLWNAASNERNFAWSEVLEAIKFTLAEFYKTVDVSSISEVDESDWIGSAKMIPRLSGPALREA